MSSSEAMPRDLLSYTRDYRSMDFEPIQIEYRRRKTLEEIYKFRPKCLLEVGCGDRPLFTDLLGVHCTIVEPAKEFAQAARRLAEDRDDVVIIQDFIEDLRIDDQQFDMVVLSSLLHEVEDAQKVLGKLHQLCGSGTVLHVNVPNANSLHRRLAVEMGLISGVEEQSETQRRMQQRQKPYSRQSLAKELEQAGFEVVAEGSIFIKPFTHQQMQRLIDEGFLTVSMLDGLSKLAEHLPDLGSEIWVNVKRAE